jgi:hypothetical protein
MVRSECSTVKSSYKVNICSTRVLDVECGCESGYFIMN